MSYSPRQKPKKRSVPEQFVHDVTEGGKELFRQGSIAVEKVKSGYRKVKRFLNK